MLQGKSHAIRGMVDILPDNANKHTLPSISLWHHLESMIRHYMSAYAYDEIRLPLLEYFTLYKRSIGEVTDIVEKEMFNFIDVDEHLALRPEGTAGCVRACINHGLIRNGQLQRLWYFGPMFRHERPQYGRYRQFYQFGVEVYGLSGPNIDVEQLDMMGKLWSKLEIDSVVRLDVNNLGCHLAREAFKEALVDYFSKYSDQLDEDSLKRLKKNPIRILDSKNPNLLILIEEAPKLADYVSKEDKKYFDAFLEQLTDHNILFKINPYLVRGLDYYNRTVYEWVTEELGAQGAICAGGRYDYLTQQLGGPKTPAIGFAMGVERVLLLIDKLNLCVEKPLRAYLVCVGESAEKQSMKIAHKVREVCPKLSLMMNYSGGSFKSQFKKADKSGADLALIICEDELMDNTITVKYLRVERSQETLGFNELSNLLGGYSEMLKGGRNNL